MTAETILRTAADVMAQRGKTRDTGRERSMARTVRAFNALTGQDMTETQGWIFMAVLKLAREQSGHDPDNFVDGAAYMALAGESCAPVIPAPCRLPDAASGVHDVGLYRDRPPACEACEEE